MVADGRAQPGSGSEPEPEPGSGSTSVFRFGSSTSPPVSAGLSPRKTPYRTDISAPSEASPLLGTTGVDGAGEGDAPPQDAWDGSRDFAGVPPWRRPSIWWLIGPYVLLTLAFGGSLVPKLNLIVSLICSRYYSERWMIHGGTEAPGGFVAPIVVGGENPQCVVPDVQREVAAFMLAVSMTTGLLAALTAPKIGALSDRYGRRRMLVLASSGGVLSEVIVILAATYPDTIHYTWLLAGSACDGLAGSLTAASVLSHSYTSDCTPPSRRGVAMGYLHAGLFVGMAGGPLIAGYFVEWTGSLVSVFYVTLGSHLLFILFSLLAMPESLSIRRQLLAREQYAREVKQATQEEEAGETIARVASGDGAVARSRLSAVLGSARLRRAARSLRVTNPLAPLQILFQPGADADSARLRQNLLALAFVDTIIMGFGVSAGTVMLLYIEYMFEWGNLEGSMFVSFVSFMRVLVLVVMLPAINYVFRTRPAAQRRRRQQQQHHQRLLAQGSDDDNDNDYNNSNTGLAVEVEKNVGSDMVDIWILRAALVSDIVSMAGYALVRSQQLFVTMSVVAALGGLGSATISAALSKHVPAERVGQLLGATGLLHALSRVVAPILFNGLYALTVESFPQAIFVLLAGLFVIALAASLLIRPHVFMKEDKLPPVRNEPLRSPYPHDVLEDEQLLDALP